MAANSIRRRWRHVAIAILLTLIVSEFTARILSSSLALDRKTAPVEVELPSNSPLFTFDPVTGYRISSEPVRYAKLNLDGTPQSVGVMKGNNQGFQDPEDFHPTRSRPNIPRIAVFGDSMTAGLFLSTNWPLRVEQLASQRVRPLEILNFSIDGGGIMNWWSILTRHLEPNHYQLDACIFAVCCDDLSRAFFIRHDDFRPPNHQLWFARVRGLQRTDLPSNIAEARKHFFFLGDAPGRTQAEMDEILNGLHRPVPRASGSKLFDLVILSLLMRHFQPQGQGTDDSPFSPECIDRILEMRESLRVLNVTPLVVQIPMPTSSDLQRVSLQLSVDQTTLEFAKLLDAEIIPVHECFAGLSSSQLSDCFLVGDAHWNQAGSDRFADTIEIALAKWFARTSPATRVQQ